MDNLLNRIFPVDCIQNMQADCLCGTSAALHVEKIDANLFRVSFVYVLDAPGTQDDCAVCIQCTQPPAFAWSPHLTPHEGYIAQQHIFRTPAVIFRFDTSTLLLLPDIRTLEEQPVHSYLDMDAPNARMMIGLSQSRVAEHVLYQKAPGAAYPAGKVEISFYLMHYDTPLQNPFRPVLDFYWARYGQADFNALTQSTKDLSPYVKHTYQWAFTNWKSIVWQEFTLGKKPVGAPVFIVTTRQSPNYKGIAKERELRSIWNQAWFCSLRSAAGLFRHARRTHNQELLAYAQKTKELALAFPQQNGLFDSVIATEMEAFEANGETGLRSKGWDTHYFGNSDRNPFGLDVKHAPKHILDMSFTAAYMLQWYQELEPDPRLLGYVSAYVQRLLSLQDPSGFFPGWVDEHGAPLGVLDHSPESAMSASLLLQYYKITQDEAARTAALAALNAIQKEIIPQGRWEDFETYWSCSPYWNNHVGQKIPRNNMYKQCNFSMYFVALALLDAYTLTKQDAFLAQGLRVLDEMLMTQSSYQPKAMPLPVVGGFGVLNADAELNDARQSLFSELIIQYGMLTQNDEYIQRGLAALRISFSMMYCPENPQAKEQWEKVWPFLNEKDYGFTMENYGHNGKIEKSGLGIGEFTIYDWGNGASAENYERMLDHFGQSFVLQ